MQLLKRLRGEGRDENIIFFSDKDLVRVYNPNNDPIIVSLMIAKHPIKRIIVDSKSLANILFYKAFVQMNFPPNQLKPVSVPLVAFNGESIRFEREITFPIMVRTLP